MTPVRKIERDHGIVGRNEELGTALAVLEAGRHLLLEGPVGVGKTTVALAVCAHLGRKTIRVDGDDRYSESKLTGWFDPPLVLQQGYREESFFAGPLVEAMRGGCVLFVDVLNRMPESVQNVLLPALDERLLQVPHIGEVRAAEGFQVVATQNPVEYVATGHLSEALRDRFEHLALAYQSAAEEADIVISETASDDLALVWTAVRLTRATRLHPRFRKGASVRGAIATVAIAERLWAARGDVCGAVDRATLRRAADAALTTRVDLRDDIDAEMGVALDEALRTRCRPRRGPRRRSGAVASGGDAPESLSALGGSRLEHGGRGRGARAPRLLPGPRSAAGRRCGNERACGALRATGRRSGRLGVAVNYTRSGCRIIDPGLRLCAERLAARAVLARAARLLGPLRAATHLVREPLLREPFAGEALDVEATLGNVLGKPFAEPGDWVIQRRVERRHQVVLMADASLSMSGENAAIAAVAAAVLAMKLRPEDVAVVVFADTARVVTHLGVADPVVRRWRMLEHPFDGYTNIAAALEVGAAELERGHNPRRSGLLITDGVVTAGADPLPQAYRFPRLFVLLTEDYKMNPQLCRSLADAGRGDVFPVCTYRDLPSRLLTVANRVLR